MNTDKQDPPKFKKTKGSDISNRLMKHFVAILVSVALVSSLFGFIGGFLANNLNGSNGGLNIIQTTTTTNKNSKVEDVSDIANKAAPSVVAITTEIQAGHYGNFGQNSSGAGSGVILSKDGYIATNNHVISDARQIKVTTSEGKNYDAKVIGSDSKADLAVLKIDAKNLKPVTLGNSDNLEVGQAAIVIGNPLGQLGGTVTTGIISSLDRQLEIDGNTMTLLQTDAAISPGNSGGGLFDSNGNLVGIVNAKASSSNTEGIGFAIPINTATTTIDSIIKGKDTDRSSDGEAAMNVSLTSSDNNVYIAQIVDGGAADKAGLQQGDKIIKIDDTDVFTTAKAKAIIRSHKPGDKIKVTIERDGKTMTVTVTLKESGS